MTDENKDDVSDKALTWMLDARYRIQKILAELYRIHRDCAKKLAGDTTLMSLSGHLTGASFSLWRAAFLVYSIDPSDRTAECVVEAQKKFLRFVVRDNAINFPQDKEARQWTSGYYITSARFRINQVCDDQKCDRPDIPRNPVKSRELAVEWDKICKAVEEFTEVLRDRCEG